MTTYTAIPDSDIDPESPGTTTLFTRLRDNPLAIAEGDATAPDIAYSALGPPTLSTGTIQISDFAFSSKDLISILSYTKLAEFRVSGTGTVNTYFGLYSSSSYPSFNAYGRVYKNGSPVGTERIVNGSSPGTFYYSEDVSVSDGDLIQFYAKSALAVADQRSMLDPKLRVSAAIPGSIVRTA